jgi:NAD-dependent deacetylase
LVGRSEGEYGGLPVREERLTTLIDCSGHALDDAALAAVADTIRGAARVVALTGAGVSVESGIPDFRSEGGLWTRFSPWEYATLTCFLTNPAKSWELFRELGKTLEGKQPNPAHRALAALEQAGRLAGIVTQNVDGLHQAAGSRNVLELHGDQQHLQCIDCGRLTPVTSEQLEPGPVPTCDACRRPLKPNVVLFEELVRHLPAIEDLLAECDVLIVAGTSAEVAPASMLPEQVLYRGGSVLEFNLRRTLLTARGLGPKGALILGPAGTTLPLIESRVRAG